MIRLADRRKPGPNGFLYTERRTNWKSWEVDPVTQWDFNLLCRRYQEHAKLNPGLQLETDLAKIEQMMDFANAMRYLKMPGADIYVSRTSEAPPKTMTPQQAASRGLLANVVGRAKNLAAGRKTLSDWFGAGGVPVAQDLANKRASVCVVCPLNNPGGLLARFTVDLASKIQGDIEELNNQKLITPHDDKINVCDACDCPLRLKVWTPLAHIVAHIPQDAKARLHENCWIRSEGV